MPGQPPGIPIQEPQFPPPPPLEIFGSHQGLDLPNLTKMYGMHWENWNKHSQKLEEQHRERLKEWQLAVKRWEEYWARQKLDRAAFEELQKEKEKKRQREQEEEFLKNGLHRPPIDGLKKQLIHKIEN